MNGTQTKFVIDTNIPFMAFYNPESKAGKVIELANKDRILLFSPESVKEELTRALKKGLKFSDEEIKKVLIKLPITWINKEVYKEFLNKTKVKHKPDKDVEAVSLLLNCGILSADKHFKDRINVNELLEKFK